MPTEHLIGADIAPLATFSMTNELATYPATNGNDKQPWNPMRSTTTGTVITLTWGGSVTLQAFGIHMHNLVGATVTLANGGGFSQVIAIPARTARGRCVDAWLDMRLLANTSAAVWTLTISGASANATIGEIVAVETASDLPWLVDGPLEIGERELAEIITTTYGVKRKLEYFVRIRMARGRTVEGIDQTMLYDLWKTVGGLNDPFLFVPNVDVNDAWLVEFDSDTIQWAHMAPDMNTSPVTGGIRPITVGLLELSGGLVP